MSTPAPIVDPAALWQPGFLVRRLLASVGELRHGLVLLPASEGTPRPMPWCSACSGRVVTLWRGPYPTDALPVFEDSDGVLRARPLASAEAEDHAQRQAYWEAADVWQGQPKPCEVTLSGEPPLVWWQAADCEAHERERRAAYLRSVTVAPLDAPPARRRSRPRRVGVM